MGGQPSQQMGGSLGPLQIPTVSSFSQSAPGQAGSQGPGLFGTAAPAHNTTGFGGGGGTTLGGGLGLELAFSNFSIFRDKPFNFFPVSSSSAFNALSNPFLSALLIAAPGTFALLSRNSDNSSC